MSLRVCTYNIEWFDRLFKSGTNLMSTETDAEERFGAIRDVLEKVNADVIGIVEAPNTNNARTEVTTARLETFAAWAGLRTTSAMMGMVSPGDQELGILFDAGKVAVEHAPSEGNSRGPRFDAKFEVDTDDNRIKEIFEFWRPPLEAEIKVKATDQVFHLILVHTKSKGIFNSMDMVRFERESMRNRRKLFAECTWIRARVDQWLDDGRKVIVMGDVNDGPGMDYYEIRFGRSGVEAIMGDLFAPDRVLRNYVGKPKWTKWGWEPASARFKDRMTHDPVNVLIDHILVSQNVAVTPDSHLVWNPYDEDQAKPIKDELKLASDHFPITIDLE